MFSSREEALALLDKWKSEGSLVTALFGCEVRFSVTGKFLLVSSDAVYLVSDAGESAGTVFLPFVRAVAFEYVDAREASGPHRKSVQSQIICGLRISFRREDVPEEVFLYERVAQSVSDSS